MNLSQCEQALQNQYDKLPNQLDNISRLTSLSRGKDKADCLSKIGGTTKVKQFVTDRSAYESTRPATQETTTTSPVVQTSTGTAASFLSATMTTVNQLGSSVLNRSAVVI